MPRVLVIDKEQANTNEMVQFLVNAGHHAVPAHSETEALQRLEREAFDAVVMDLSIEGPNPEFRILKETQRLSIYTKVVIAPEPGRVPAAVSVTELGAKYIMKAADGNQQHLYKIVDVIENVKRKACVLMPFSKPFDSYYHPIFKPALQVAGYTVIRADDFSIPRPIIMDIHKMIVEADLVLCEMSGGNPNVFYELGLAHAIGKPAILVSQREEKIPFDLAHVRVIMYDKKSSHWTDTLKRDITEAAKEISETDEVWPPPLIAPNTNP